MKTILVLGAGRSSHSLIKYLLHHAQELNWFVIVGDASLQQAQEVVGDSRFGEARTVDVADHVLLHQVMTPVNVVISMLPAFLHSTIAGLCLSLKKHLLTASYVSDEMKALHDQVIENDLLFLNECGLDPGIDHMSAMKIIDSIKGSGGSMISFESFTGGLISPETDMDNPWRYKFTWNPRNVVMAGQGTAKFLENNCYKYVPYQQLFRRTTRVSILGLGDFEGYANRDSLVYQSVYGLDNLQTMIRGTLRNEGFCAAWNILLQLGCCDDSFKMEGVATMTHREFINSFLPFHHLNPVEEKIQNIFNLDRGSHEMKCLKWSGFFDDEPIGLGEGSPARILEHILNKKWKLNALDKDMIVMWHRFRYLIDGGEKFLEAYMVVKGEDNVETAMSKTVGLPLGIAAKNLLLDKIKLRGVVIPVKPALYTPILEELEWCGIKMVEQVT